MNPGNAIEKEKLEDDKEIKRQKEGLIMHVYTILLAILLTSTPNDLTLLI